MSTTIVDPLLRGMTIATGPINHRFDGLGNEDALLVGAKGCTLSCAFCQNHEISQSGPIGPYVSDPYKVGKILRDRVINDGLGGVLFTYSEPLRIIDLVGSTHDFLRACFGLNKFVAVKTSAHTNEYTWRSFLRSVNFLNVDVKGDDDFYRSTCGGFFDAVLRNTKIAVDSGKHVELTFLIIPGMEEGMSMAMADMAREVGDVPAWIRGFVPAYKMQDFPMATNEDILWAKDMASHYFSCVRTDCT